MGIYSTKSEEVVICGQRFVVRQATTEDASMYYLLVKEAIDAFNVEFPDLIAKEAKEIGLNVLIKRNMRTVMYPACISITKSLDAPLPTLKEFEEMPGDEVEKWVQIVSKFNPTFVSPELSEQEQAAENEKKS